MSEEMCKNSRMIFIYAFALSLALLLAHFIIQKMISFYIGTLFGIGMMFLSMFV